MQAPGQADTSIRAKTSVTLCIDNPGWTDRLARVVSHLLSPVGTAVLALGVLGWTDRAQAVWLAVSAMALVVLPAAVLVLLARRSRTADILDPSPARRQFMLICGTGCYLLSYIILESLGVRPELRWMGATFLLGSATVWAINRAWKLSIHSTGIGGGVIMLYAWMPALWPLWVGMILSVGWARYHLRAHDLPQLAAGLLLGGGLALALKGLYV